MATDNSPPRLKLIVTIGFITIVTLIGLRFVLESYFAFMGDMARREKIAPPTELDDHRKEEQAALTAAKVPVGEAIAQLSKGSRGGVAPQQSDDLGPMTGWTKLPKAAPEAHPGQTSEAAADAGAEGEATDGGEANAAGDGGAAVDAGPGRVVPVGAHDGGVTDAGLPVPAPTPRRPLAPRP